jgi:hypothetical protein
VDKALYWKKQYVPVLTLDDVIDSLNPSRIFFLNIDTEGLDIEVLLVADRTLERTVLLCIEVFDEARKIPILQQLAKTHDFIVTRRMGCDLMWVNRRIVPDFVVVSGGRW